MLFHKTSLLMWIIFSCNVQYTKKCFHYCDKGKPCLLSVLFWTAVEKIECLTHSQFFSHVNKGEGKRNQFHAVISHFDFVLGPLCSWYLCLVSTLNPNIQASSTPKVRIAEGYS